MLRTTIAAVASAFVAVGLVVVPAHDVHAATATSSHVAQPAAAVEGSTSVSIAPTNAGALRPGEDLPLAVTVTNDTADAVPAGQAGIDIIRNTVSSRSVLSDWFDNTSTDGYVGLRMHRIDVPEVPAHRSVTVSFSVTPAERGALYAFGPRQIAASYSAGSTIAVGRSAFTWLPDDDEDSVAVSVAMPITVPATSERVLGARALAALTAVDGTLTKQLDAADGHNVALGIDPRIIASIRLLGDDAPSSATTWLERLTGMRNETFALPWADADVTGLRQAGATGILAPISLDQLVEPDRFPGAATPTPTPTGSPDPTTAPDPSATPTTPTPATTTPTSTAAADGQQGEQGEQGQPGQQGQQGEQGGQPDDGQAAETLPTTASLLDFPYTLPDVAWPVEGTVAAADLPALATAGTKRTVIASGNTSAGADATVGASQQVSGQPALVTDETASDALRDVAAATSRQSRLAATADLTATLAMAARDDTLTAPVLLTLGRSWPTDGSGITSALDAVEQTPWVSPTDLTAAVSAPSGTLSVTNASDGDDRIDQLSRLVASEKATTDFSSALTTPTDLTAPERLRTLAAASNGWRADPDGLVAVVDAREQDAAEQVSSVGIVDSSDLTLLGDRSSLPISVRNESEYPVTVYATVTPSNSTLRVIRNDLEVTVQPDSSTRITFPVQSVANGKVSLALSLHSGAGVPIADPASVEINVQAQWETIITGIAAAAVVLVFGFGIVRNVRRRIRRRNGLEPDDDDLDPNRPLEEQPPAPGQDVPEDRTGGPAPLPGAASAIAVAGSATSTAESGGDRLEDAITRSGAEPGLPAGAGGAASDQPSTAPATGPTQRSLGRASAMLAAGTMVSRVLGFAKTFVLAYAIGQNQSPSANAFAVANQLPNNIYALIAGGLLSAVLIPQIVRAMKRNSDGGQDYVNKIVTLGGSAFIVITVIGTLLAPGLVRLYSTSSGASGKGFDQATTDLAIAFAFWCLPQILFYAMYSLLGEVLNARQVFGPFTWAPLLNNVIAVTGLIVFIAMFGGRSEHTAAGGWTPTEIAVLAGSASLGVVAQAAFLPVFWKRAGLSFRPDFRWRGVGLKATGTAAGWLFAMILVTQVAGIVQSRAASLGNDHAGNAVLQNAWLLFMLPHSIITVSIATAYFTRMSHDAERGDLDAVRRNLSTSLRIVGLFTVFASVALIVVAVPFGRVYENTFSGALSVAGVLAAYMPGLVLFSMLFIIQRVFWALHDHRTPFLMQLVQSGLFVIGAVAVTFLPGSLIGVALAVCTTIAGSAQTIVALVVVRRRLGGIEGAVVTRSHVQFVIAALIAGVVGVLVANFFGAFAADGFAMTDVTSALITLVLTGAAMVVVYFGALVVAKNGEVQSAVVMLKGRLGR